MMTSETEIRESLSRLLSRHGTRPEALMPILQGLQEQFRHLPPLALRLLAEEGRFIPARIEGVASFYSQFRRRPAGKYRIRVCHGTACHVAGAEKITEALRRVLKIENPAEDTDTAQQFTLERVACLGCCSLAPVLKIEDLTFGHLKPQNVGETLETFLQEVASGALEARRQQGALVLEAKKGGWKTALQKSTAEPFIRLGLNSCCMASGGTAVKEALETALQKNGRTLEVCSVGCVGMCHQVPLLEIRDDKGERQLYGDLDPALAVRLVEEHFPPQSLWRKGLRVARRGLDLLFEDSAWQDTGTHRLDPNAAGAVKDFLSPQVPVVTEGRGTMDPLDLEAYRASGGYEALKNALQKGSPEEVLETIATSGLRGRGGAGYTTGLKWRAVRQARLTKPEQPCYVLCNGDEGDPGAFMDRMLLEGYPHRVLEGLALAAYAVGATEAILYIRAEYPLAVQRIQAAIRQAVQAGWLGERIQGSSFSLPVSVREGAGAFICGEETGLIASLEGRRGHPTFRPPYPATQGLFGAPTLINNVETLASVPYILRQGAAAFQSIGSGKSRGTKVFALAGKVRRPGLVEVPMGMTLRQIVEAIGGGVKEGRTFKAVQIGGPSGGCLPASLAETPVDYEAIAATGAILGSGGLIVLDDTDCLVDLARYFLSFTQHESCGQCVACRIGTRRLLEILERLCEGKGQRDDLERLETLALDIKRSSLCGLGQTAPNPVLTTLRYFREEYEAHLEGRCPAKKCRALIRYEITDQCIGCALCARQCPVQAIEPKPYQRHEIDGKKCVRCGACRDLCPVQAIEVRTPI